MVEQVVLVESPEARELQPVATGDPTELEFYQSYGWSLNPHPTVNDAIEHLGNEIAKLAIAPEDWRRDEVAANVFLLAGGILNRMEEYVRGDTLRLPRRLQSHRVARGARRVIEALSADWRRGHRPRVHQHMQQFRASLREFLLPLATDGGAPSAKRLSDAASGLASLLQEPLPESLGRKHLRTPSPFWRLDLTHRDVLALGRRLVERHPDRSQPIVLVGLRTSGSYFCPLLQAFLNSHGYQTTAALTIEPNKGPGLFERRQLKQLAMDGYLAVIVDDPPFTAGALLLGFGAVRRAGFPAQRVRFLAPTHSARRDWWKNLPHDLVITLMPEEWDKARLLEPAPVEARLNAYLEGRGASVSSIVPGERSDRLNAELAKTAVIERGVRLKRVFDVEITAANGSCERRLLLVRSVGFGWYAYRAFFAARRLSDFVPPIYGMRDGLVFMDWCEPLIDTDPNRDMPICRLAAYVAERSRALRLDAGSLNAAGPQGAGNALERAAHTLAGAYGAFPVGTLRQARVVQSLRKLPWGHPTFIDGNMRRSEWIDVGTTHLKVDYEHHGLGKDVLNHSDPAYDLADAVLNFGLSPDEEQHLLDLYRELSGDEDVGRRLFANKFLAGIWELSQAQEQLTKRSLDAPMQKDAHDRFMRSWHFLIREMARQCGTHCQRPQKLAWQAPLVVLDIDGVIDRRIFGFPSTTRAGIAAISHFHAHGLSVALDTARSAPEVKDYCRAYSLAGGVAELGSYMWDAVRGHGEVLLTKEDLRQLRELRGRLRTIPGVFLDDQHQYSVRAFVYKNEARGMLAQIMESTRAAPYGQRAVGPLPDLLVNEVLGELGLDRLTFHQNAIDTTFVSKHVDKGTGLVALRNWVLEPTAETNAVGDSDQDFPMFREATHSFGPSNISRTTEAELLGCRVVHAPYQRGLLQIAQLLTGGGVDARGAVMSEGKKPKWNPDPWTEVLAAADRHWAVNFIGSVFDRSALRVLTR